MSAPIQRPEHHIHASSQPLPGARGGDTTTDYSPETIERITTAAFDDPNLSNMPSTREHYNDRSDDMSSTRERHNERLDDMAPTSLEHHNDRSTDMGPTSLVHHGDSSANMAPTSSEHHGDRSANAFNEDRPMDVQPAPGGGVSIGGNDDLPMGKAGFGDKVIGKTQKVSNHSVHVRSKI